MFTSKTQPLLKYQYLMVALIQGLFIYDWFLFMVKACENESFVPLQACMFVLTTEYYNTVGL